MDAIEVGRAHHPDVGVATFSVEEALLQVKIHQASPSRGGAEESALRQAQEILAKRRTELDTARDRIQENIVATWDRLEAAKSRILAAQALVAASEIGLNDQREQARTGALNARRTRCAAGPRRSARRLGDRPA